MKHLIRTAAALLISLPMITSAATVADLQAQAQALLQQVANLQAQLSAGGTSITTVVPSGGTLTPTGSSAATVSGGSCPQIGSTLKVGSTGDAVLRLQQFLALDPSVYPEAQVTGYFGGLTQAAVQRWQVKYNIVSSGSPETTGFGQVGPRTAAAIALQCSGAGGAVGTQNSGTVGGFIQVSPISGQAPLTVNVTANVNTVLSCTGATYILNWGDNSPPQTIPVSAGNCSQLSQTYRHIYVYGGTYVVTLSAGGHQTTATVVVSGSAGTPVTPIPSVILTPSLPTEIMTVSTTTGQTPLTVTFSGTVTGADHGWCASGCTSTLDFGDGASTQIPLPSSSMGVQNFSVQHAYTTAGSFTAKLYQGQAAAGHSIVGSPTTITVVQSLANYSYGPLAVTPNVGQNALAVSAQFDLPNSCTGYDLSWGDGTADQTQAESNTSCPVNVVTKTFNHTYSAAGSYAITLRRGANLTKQDSVSIVISN